MSDKDDDKDIKVTATQPNFALKKKLGDEVSIADALTDEAIADAESAIQESKDNFFADALKDLHGMEDAYVVAFKTPKTSAPHVKEIMTKAHSLKGQAETLGFELLAHACASLYEFCDKHFREGDKEQLIVIRKHMDTLKVIIKEKMKGDGGQVGKELIQHLHLLTKKYK